MNITFIRIFNNEAEASNFAIVHQSKVIVRYDWDEISNIIIKQFIVKY